MANLSVNNYRGLDLRLNGDEYWDFFVNKDPYQRPYGQGAGLYDKCLVSYFDLSDEDCVDGDWIQGKPGYAWSGSTSVGYTLYNISYTGVDNGLFTFRKDRITNREFMELFRGNKLRLDEDDTRLRLHAVSGNTMLYDYPMRIDDGHAVLNGGFFQGFFKTECGKYQVLPDKFEDGDTLNFEFSLKRCGMESESDKTLNDKYPDNKGIFFYIGTRAENKWVYNYDKDDVDGLEDCYELGTGDFVEDGEIDKKDYIIGYFSNPNPDFDGKNGYDPFELGDYTNYNYYDDRLYESNPCDWGDLSDYIDVEYSENAVTIDENKPHTTLSWCCGDSDDVSTTPFFKGCGCPVSHVQRNSDKGVQMGSEFGDGYIVDNSGLMSVEEATDYIEAELDISDFDYQTDNGFSLSEANQYYFYTDNKFLFFNRTKTGETVSSWVDGTQFMFSGRRSRFSGNLFILMNRTRTGYTVSDIDELRDKSANEYDPYTSIYDNALAFRITDSGSIGYRMLTKDCDIEGRDKSSVIEGYSFDGVVPECEWVTVHVRMAFMFGKMKLMFYVNGKLVYITKDLPKLRLRALDELYEKQEGVPYNISLGGGTQGLAETILQNYMLNPTRVYPIERNFAGTFIGYISSFRIYDCMMEKRLIESNHMYELKKKRKA